jgi:seryl-tRNA synthetase
MLDIRLLREKPESVKENIKKKFQDEKLSLVDKVLKLDIEWRKLKTEGDELRAERNAVSKKINEAKKTGDEKRVKSLIKKAKSIPEEIAKLDGKRKKLENEIRLAMMVIPNIIGESVPIGKDDSENVELKKFGDAKVPKYAVIHHTELAEKNSWVDFDPSRETSGSGFFYLAGELAMLHSAMLAFARDYMIEQGFTYVIPPFMIRKKVVEGVMSFKEMDAMMYKIDGEDLYLIGTSEHSLIGRFIDRIIPTSKIPLLITGYSPCFRKEVGAHGIEQKGFYRLHQFEKQEMVVICEPEESYKWYEKMWKYTVEVFTKLGIPVRTLEICSGDLADLKSKSCDIEAWSPRQKEYFEIGSCSNLTDAQARRLNIRIDGKGKIYFAHTLNNTVLASPRALIAFLENNQQANGTIKIPAALQSYMNGKKVIGIALNEKRKEKK